MEARHIAAVTFTNKAAREMKERVDHLLRNQKTRGLAISTFHTLGLEILKREHKLAGYKPGFSIFDAQDSESLLRELLAREKQDDATAQTMQWRISGWKNNLLDPTQALSQAQDELDQRAALLFAAYQRALRAYNAVDFDDLILAPVALFRDHREALERWQNRIRYLLVDEYQDTNLAQYELVRQLVGIRQSLTVVGDDDQSIYAWRGARPENLRQLAEDFPRLKVIKLEQNYRCTGRILKAANTLIANNPHLFEKRLWSALGPGEPLRVLRARDETHEAEWVVSEILSHRFRHRTEFRDYAILYRGNHQARLFEQVLREHRVPYFLSGSTSFFERAEVRDLLAYLRLLVNPDDDTAFLRVVNTPRREIGPTTLERLGAYAGERGISLHAASLELGLEQHLPERAVQRLRRFGEWLRGLGEKAARSDPAALLRELIDETGYRAWLGETSPDPRAVQRRLQVVDEVLDWVARLGGEVDGGLRDVVARMTLMDILDRQDEENTADRVSLMTLHSAKGLEFAQVFLVGMEEDLLPHRSSIEEGNVEEERRLAYVGITRARRGLTLSLAARRRRGGEWQARTPSRFLAELSGEDLQWQGGDVPAPAEERQARGQAHLANLRAMLRG
jgi:ATP-dependent DNA helicase Rep